MLRRSLLLTFALALLVCPDYRPTSAEPQSAGKTPADLAKPNPAPAVTVFRVGMGTHTTRKMHRLPPQGQVQGRPAHAEGSRRRGTAAMREVQSTASATERIDREGGG